MSHTDDNEIRVSDEQLERITERIYQGLVKYKSGESDFWSESQKYHRKMEEQISGLEQKLDKGLEKLDRIEEQTIKTNGRVLKLEGENFDTAKDLSTGKGAVKIIGLVVGVVIVILGYFATMIIDQGNRISEIRGGIDVKK